MFTGIYRNPILITEIQLYYQVYHDLCEFRHIYCEIIYKQIIWPSLEDFFWNNNDFINVFTISESTEIQY